MSKTLRSAVLASLALGAASFAHADELGIGITITGEITPGVYGRVDISNRPVLPPLVYAQPVIIEPPPPDVLVEEPIYLHVPPGHARHWRKHCHEYHACGRPVYFVRSVEYDPDYVPREHEHHHGDDDDDDQGHGHGHHKHHDDD